MSSNRERNIRKHKQAAPEDSYFMGFGGTSRSCETMVFSVARDVPGINRLPYSFEVRIPLDMRGWSSLEAIEFEYGCIAGRNWQEVEERLAE